jgi:hypothetical protein
MCRSMSDETRDPKLTGAGLSATGKTADELSPGEQSPGTTYGGPSGTGTAEQEGAQTEPDANAGQDASGDVEGAPDQR